MSTLSPTLSKAEAQTNSRSLLGKFWDLITKPSDQILEPDKRQQARFVSALLAFIITAVVILVGHSLTVPPTATTTNPEIYILIVGMVSAIYLVSRTKRAELAIILFVVTTMINLFIVHLSNPETAGSFYYLTIGVLFAGILLSVRTTAILVIITSVALLIVNNFVARTTDISSIVNFVIIFSGVVVVFVQFRNTLENTRKAELTDALQKVETLNQTLSQTNTELVKASAVAKEAARLKSEFMATMSHELRTPLNAMLGFSGILLQGIGGEFDEDARHMIERIEENSKRLLTLINDVLDIAKIEAGRLELVITPISPRKLTEMWRSQVGVLGQQKKLDFIVEIDPALPNQFYGDSERISQVAINLLSNAFKFTETGSVKLALKRKDTTNWQIEVTDTGIGIPPHALNYIFDEFRQFDGTSKRAYAGTGLGLAIVRNLCRMMEGTVSVTSKLGEGSVFTVTLPLKPVAASEPRPA